MGHVRSQQRHSPPQRLAGSLLGSWGPVLSGFTARRFLFVQERQQGVRPLRIFGSFASAPRFSEDAEAPHVSAALMCAQAARVCVCVCSRLHTHMLLQSFCIIITLTCQTHIHTHPPSAVAGFTQGKNTQVGLVLLQRRLLASGGIENRV